ncbi:MAG: hypothetical protein K6U11_08305 [bacterium]|nr:hypothetical protein [bacterium]
MISQAQCGQALFCVNDRDSQQKLARILEELGYQLTICSQAEKAVEQIKATAYRVIILEEGFEGGVPWPESPIWQELAQMPMSLRRQTFVILLARGGKHLDPMAAFSLSANLLLDKGRVREDERLGAVLEQEILNYAKFYQVYERVKEQISQGR